MSDDKPKRARKRKAFVIEIWPDCEPGELPMIPPRLIWRYRTATGREVIGIPHATLDEVLDDIKTYAGIFHLPVKKAISGDQSE